MTQYASLSGSSRKRLAPQTEGASPSVENTARLTYKALIGANELESRQN